MIRATFDTPGVQAADGPAAARRISGVAVPYGVSGRVSDGTEVIFEPGSLDAAARPVALRDHDRARPIGRVVDAVDRGDRLDATVRVSRTHDGDEALVLAADDVLGMFSVGVEPTDWHYAGDVLHVDAGDWQELSLLTIGAYPAARVASVTAAPPESENTMPDELPALDVDDDPVDPFPDPDAEPDEPEEEARVPAVPITAARHPSARRGAPGRDVTLRQLSGLVQAAVGGDDRARRIVHAAIASGGRIEAAFTNVTLVGTDNINTIYRPAYQAELMEIVSMGSPVVDVIRQGDLQRGDFPNKSFVQWTKTPQVVLQANEKDEIGSSAVATAVVSVPVKTWATGNDISQQVLDFGSPGVVEDWIRAAAVDYAQTIDTYAVTVLMGAATAVTTLAGDSFIGIVQKLMAALNPTQVPDGSLFLAVSYDVGVGLIGVKTVDGPAFWDGSVNFGTYKPTVSAGGLEVIVDANLPSKTYLLGLRSAATWYDLPGTPFNLRAINVGHLGLDIALYGYGACGVQYPAALVKTTQP